MADRAGLRDLVTAAIKASPFQELRAVNHDPNGPLQITVKVDDLADVLVHRLAAAVLSASVDRADAAQCPDREPLLGVQCTKRAGHEVHSDRPGRIWYPVADDDQTASVDRADALREEAAEPAPIDRAALSAKLWKIAEHHIVAEWICCEPLNPLHSLCAKGYAALGMARTLLVDSPEAWNPEAPLLNAVIAELRRMAAETPNTTETDALPRRGDEVEAWLKAQRDAHPRPSHGWYTVDCVLDTYRLHADTGTQLTEHVCEARVVGDCDCLETPSAGGVQQPKEDRP